MAGPSLGSLGARIAIAAAALLFTAATVYQPPYLLISPGAAVDMTGDVAIKGVPAQAPSTTYLLVTVNVRRASALRAALAMLGGESRVVRKDEIYPAGVSEEEYLRHQRDLFRESQVAAAAAAARRLGLPVKIDGHGARIYQIAEGSPAEKELRVGDVITEIDGTPVRLATDLPGITTTRPPGTRFRVTARRDGRNVSTTIRSRRLEGFNAAGTGIGIRTVTSGLEAELPFDIAFRRRSIGGPSAGLVYALTISDMLDGEGDSDRVRRTVAATGAIFPDGDVGRVGAVGEKARVARAAGADVLLVPDGEAGRAPGVLPVREVATLDDALAVLKAS